MANIIDKLKPLLIGAFALTTAFFAYGFLVYEDLKTGQLAVLQDEARQKADAINSRLVAELNVIRTLAQSDALKLELRKSNRERAGYDAERLSASLGRMEEVWKSNDSAAQTLIAKKLGSPSAEILRRHQSAFDEVYGEIFLTDRNGVTIGSTGKLTTVTHAYKYWWREAFDDGRGRVFIDDRGFDNSVNDIVLGFVVPVKSDDVVIGILKANVFVRGFMQSPMARKKLQHLHESIVARSSGFILSKQDTEPLSQPVAPELKPHLLRDELLENGGVANVVGGRLTGIALVDISKNTSEIKFGGNPKSIDQSLGNRGEYWVVVASEKYRLLDAVEDVGRSSIVIIALWLAFTFGFIRLLAFRRRINQQAGAQQSMSAPLTTLDVIGDIEGAIDSVTTSAKVALAAEQRYRNLIDNMLQEVHLWEIIRNERGEIETWKLLDINPAAEKAWGVSRDDVLGKTTEEIFSPSARDLFMPIVQKIFNEGIPHEWETYFPDKKQYLHMTSASWDKYFVSTGTDVTKQREMQASILHEKERAEALVKEKETLIQEVHHRVKNNLQVILSMLSLQKRSSLGDHEVNALNESSRRVRVMAKLYEHLYQSDNVADIDPQEYFSDVVRDSLHASGAPDGVKHSIECEPITLKIKAATALAQIISELVSNCIKHAFPSGEGNIAIHLVEREDGYIYLTVKDDGIGLPEGFDEKKLKSMGIKLINALVSQLGAEKHVTSDNGTIVEIVFKEEG